MATVLRVKRRSDEEPLEALLFACKRRKKEDELDPLATVVKLAATVRTQEEDISVLLPVKDKEEIWKSRLEHKVDILNKLRERRKEASESGRYKVVNYFRRIKEPTEKEKNDEDSGNNIIVFDIESSSVKTSDESDQKDGQMEDVGYVYDLYYGHTGMDYDYAELDHVVDIMPYSQSWDYGPARGGAADDDSAPEEDEDDSNDENNWRNDYPDSDHSINEDDMRLAMQLKSACLESDLSSDEDLIQCVKADSLDIARYGQSYASYKARMKREVASSSSEGEISIEAPSDDSEDEDPVLRYM